MNSHLLEGTLRHRRFQPSPYALEHSVFYFGLDLAELDQVGRRLRLVSRNRRNIVSFRDTDHLAGSGTDLREQVDEQLVAAGADPTGWSVTLVANLRVFGYQFNPASFYLCRDPAGRLAAVLIEVHNTHGERHVYPLLPQAGADPVRLRAEMDKTFYVSPFIDMAARYRVTVMDEPKRLRVAIAESDAAGSPLLTATLVLRRRPLSDASLVRMLVRHPLVTHRTIVSIHWHALRLWRRGLRFHRHRPARPATTQPTPHLEAAP
jgi:DUF1365 family protein